MNNAMIQRRADAREQARTAAGLVVEEAGRIPADARAAFWEELQKMLIFPQPLATAPARPAVEPMTDRQARTFGLSLMPFGEFRGDKIDDVPLDRLEYYAEPTPFVRMLRKYLASRRIQDEDNG